MGSSSNGVSQVLLIGYLDPSAKLRFPDELYPGNLNCKAIASVVVYTEDENLQISRPETRFLNSRARLLQTSP